MTLITSSEVGIGYSIHVGINRLSPESATYGPQDPAQEGPLRALRACENDAKAYAKISVDYGFSHISLLIGENATRDNFLSKMDELAALLRPQDLLFISFSGHGGQVPDISGDETNDGLDEVWCFYDTVILDDELFEIWGEFQTGARIIVISDSCHSGDILKGSMEQKHLPGKPMFTHTPDLDELPASIQLMAACREDQMAREKYGEKDAIWHGALSCCILENTSIMERMTYSELYSCVNDCVRGSQRPRRQLIGLKNESFFEGIAFEI